MKILTRAVILALLLVSSAPAAERPRSPEPGMVPVSLQVNDMPTAKVLESVFAAAGVRGDIDPCVGGRISLSLESVPLGTALDAIARLAGLNIARGSSTASLRVTCREPSTGRGRSRSTGEPVSLKFRIESVDSSGRREVRAEARLATTVGEIEEASGTGSIPGFALSEDGELIATPPRPAWTVRAVVVPGKYGSPRELRGILEITTEASHDPAAAVVSVTQPFHATLVGERDLALASTEVSGTTWVVTLASVE